MAGFVMIRLGAREITQLVELLPCMETICLRSMVPHKVPKHHLGKIPEHRAKGNP